MSGSSGPRQDRFDYTIPIVTQAEFYKTNFLKCYDQTEKHPAKTSVINSLRALENGTNTFQQIIQSIEKESDEYDVIRTYSSDFFVSHQKFYCYVNQQLCGDSMETTSKLMPLIRRATRQINYHAPSTELVVYRGMTLTNSQKAYFTTGTIFRFPGFTSTSKSKAKAQIFGSDTLFEIHIYAGCLQVRDIASVSYYPSEEEYLFSPYSLFEVTAKTANLIVLKAIDNMNRVAKCAIHHAFCNSIDTSAVIEQIQDLLSLTKKYMYTTSENIHHCIMQNIYNFIFDIFNAVGLQYDLTFVDDMQSTRSIQQQSQVE